MNFTPSRVDVFVCHAGLLAWHGVVYQSAIRARLGITRASMSMMLHRLERRGFIRRYRSDADRRNVIVEITDAGRAAYAEIRHLVDDRHYSEIVNANLTFIDFHEAVPVKRRRLLRYLDALRKQFGDYSQMNYPP